MDQGDEDEFLYGDAPSATTAPVAAPHSEPSAQPTPSAAAALESGEEAEDDEEEEEEEEIEVSDSDSDIELVTERKDGTRAEPPPRPERYNQIRTASARPVSTPPVPQAAGAAAPKVPLGPGESHPPVATSKLDIQGNPLYKGEPITKISLDSDILPSDKPWRKPGADVTDYFNYGFDEFTWTAYCAKQEGIRDEFNPQKMMEQMMMMSGMGMGMTGMTGMEGMEGMMGAVQAPDMTAMSGVGAGGVDPSMFMGQDGGFGMGRGGMPPQGPAAAMNPYGGGYEMQGARGPAPFGPRGRGGPGPRRW